LDAAGMFEDYPPREVPSSPLFAVVALSTTCGVCKMIQGGLPEHFVERAEKTSETSDLVLL
jgi:hypothetical protein